MLVHTPHFWAELDVSLGIWERVMQSSHISHVPTVEYYKLCHNDLLFHIHGRCLLNLSKGVQVAQYVDNTGHRMTIRLTQSLQ